MTGPLAEAITGLDGCAGTLAGLARTNSFVVPLDAAQTRFRYHQLFAEILRHDVQRKDRSAVPVLMRRAAAHFERTGDFRNALYWAAKAGDVRHAAALLANGGLAHAFVHGEDPSGLHLESWQAPPLPRGADAAQAREAAVVSSAVVAVMADAESAARQLRTQDQTADQQLTPESRVPQAWCGCSWG